METFLQGVGVFTCIGGVVALTVYLVWLGKVCREQGVRQEENYHYGTELSTRLWKLETRIVQLEHPLTTTESRV